MSGVGTAGMARARLAVDVGETWIGRLTREHAARIVLTAVIPEGESRGTAMARVSGPDRAAAAERLATHASVQAARRVETDDDPLVVTVETTAPVLQAPVRAAGIPFEPPLSLVDGVADLTVTASTERLDVLTKELDAAGHDYTVEAVHSSVATAGPLTDRQETVLATAVDAGYYERPRACSLADLAEELGVGKSAVSETLRRAEGRLARRYVEDGAGVDGVDDP